MAKVKIALDPYNALILLSFLREFVNDELTDDYQFTAIREAVDEYEIVLANSITDEQYQEIDIINQVNQLIGKSPKRIK